MTETAGSPRRPAGALLADLLIEHGVRHVFGVPGGQTLALYDGILDRAPMLQHVLTRDERSAAYAADSYARITGRAGVCDATVGPGAAMLAPVTKWHATVADPVTMPALVRQAFREATTGRPGPVVLFLPQDVLDGPAADPAAGGDLPSLAEQTSAAVGTTLSGKGAIAEDHPLSVGVTGSMGTSAAAAALAEADVVLLAGTKASGGATFSWTLPRADQAVLQ